MINGGVIVFFYVDDIVICYKKQDGAKAKATVDDLYHVPEDRNR